MKNNIFYKICIVIILLSVIPIKAQQLPQFTQYMYNTISINPAYAGSREALSLVGLHRSQWVGIEDGPTTQTVSVHAPTKNEKVGLGLSFINDRLGFENFAYIYGDFSYTIPTGIDTKLAFGLKAGLTHYNLDEDLLNDTSIMADPFFNDISNRWSPNIGAGVYWHSSKWYLGLSAPRILNTDYNKGSDVGSNLSFVALERVSYYLTGGYVFDLSASTKFKPSFLMKLTNGAPASYDLTGNFLFNDKFWLGAGYRFNESAGAFGALADFQLTDQIRIGYTYEHPISDIRAYSSGTHEVLLMFELRNKRKRIKSPRYF